MEDEFGEDLFVGAYLFGCLFPLLNLQIKRFWGVLLGLVGEGARFQMTSENGVEAKSV